MTIADRIKNVRQDIRIICDKYLVDPKKMKLLAVSKTYPISAIQAAFESGLSEFGESYLNEALEKIHALKHLPLCWHFIGPMQSNKTRQIAANFDWVQSVDRGKILERLSQQRPSELPPLNICLQINYFNEPQKKGAKIEDVIELLELTHKLPNMSLRGLMAIPPKTGCFDTQQSQYRQIYDFYNQCKLQFPQMDTLSIGMSGDIEAAISAGSTMIRIGTALFGPREKSVTDRDL